MKICQACGKEIKLGEKAVEVKYGKMGATAHPHYKVDAKENLAYMKNQIVFLLIAPIVELMENGLYGGLNNENKVLWLFRKDYSSKRKN